MTNEGKHTPTPFGSFIKNEPDAATDFPCVVITSSNGCPLAYVGNHAEYKETAAFIVRAVNCHDELVKALLAATHALRSYQYGNGSPDLAEQTADFCDITLAKATGKEVL